MLRRSAAGCASGGQAPLPARPVHVRLSFVRLHASAAPPALKAPAARCAAAALTATGRGAKGLGRTNPLVWRGTPTPCGNPPSGALSNILRGWFGATIPPLAGPRLTQILTHVQNGLRKTNKTNYIRYTM